MRHAKAVAREAVTGDAIRVVRAHAENIAGKDVTIHAMVVAKTVPWGLQGAMTAVRLMVEIILPRAVVETVQAIALDHVAEGVKTAVLDSVQVALAVVGMHVRVAKVLATLLVGGCVEAIVKVDVRVDVALPAGMHAIDHVGQILPLLEGIRFFK